MHAVRHRGAGKGHEGNHVYRANPRMNAGMAAQIDAGSTATAAAASTAARTASGVPVKVKTER